MILYACCNNNNNNNNNKLYNFYSAIRSDKYKGALLDCYVKLG